MGLLLQSVFEWLFGCRHKNLSHVFTIQGRTYQVCCDCGSEFDYSWERMRRSRSPSAQRAYAQLSLGATYHGFGELNPTSPERARVTE